MRYVIVGAGAIGGVLGARLAQHVPDHPPLFIARGDHGAALMNTGIRLRTPSEDVRLTVAVASGPADVKLLADDVLVLAVKTQQAAVALAEWVDQPVFTQDGADGAEPVGTAGEHLPILIAMNGVETERLALRLFRRVFGVCVWLPAVHLTPGEVILRIGPKSGIFIIGRVGLEADDGDRNLLSSIEDDWTRATFGIHLVDDVMRWKYNKLLSNLANGLDAMLGPDEDFSDAARRLRTEAELIFRETGVEWASEMEEADWRGDLYTIKRVPGAPEHLGGSSWQSLARGAGSIETDYLNGEIVLIARQHGLDAPLNAVVQRLAREHAVKPAGARSMTLAELEAVLG
ncbi:MAG TPA: 2-dehydropantoate 2-reductase N-terminal domain-containing protein [Galbitalea sp.]